MSEACAPVRAPFDFDELAYSITHEKEHPVMRYVRSLPFEPAVYPANMYRGFGNTGNGPDDYITWIPPAHDLERPKLKGCGYIRQKGSTGITGVKFTACSGDAEHYAKGKRSHCWSLTCPVCANDTALRIGNKVEAQFETHRVLKEKQGYDLDPLGHWVISPVQELMKSAMQTVSGFNAIRKHTEHDLMAVGASGGVLVIHPWRQQEDYWKFSPHFHGIVRGYLDTDLFREMNPGWVIKKIHADSNIISIGQTAAYLATHMGIGEVERDVSEVDYGLRFMCHMLPGLSDDDYRSSAGAVGSYGAATGRAFRYTDDDYLALAEGKGRMVGDVSDMDWMGFTMDPLHYRTRLIYFGELSQKNIRTVATEREVRQRVCRACGRPLNTYNGMCDLHGEPTRYNFDNTIRTFREDYETVKGSLDLISGEMKENGVTLADIAPKTALIVSKDEIIPKDSHNEK